MKQTFAFSNALHRIAGSGSILTVIAVLSVAINTGTVTGAPVDEARKAAGMGVERVARLFTPVYQSNVISFTLPMGFRTTCYRGAESGFNDGAHYSLEYGPVLMALTGKVEGQDGVNADPKRLSELLRPIPGKPLHFEVTGNDPLIYQPYWELQDERFTCFPRIQKIK